MRRIWIILACMSALAAVRLVVVRSTLEAAENLPIPCTTVTTNISCFAEGSITITNLDVFPLMICLGDDITAFAETGSSDALIQEIETWSPASPDCPPVTNIYPEPVSLVTSFWAVAGPGAFVANGDGLEANFSPTNCGSGTITFYLTYSNPSPCSSAAGTLSSANFTVTHVEIVPAQTNALINKCQDPNRSVTFSLTNSCGGVTWSLDPAGIPDGASLTANGDSATVTIGDVEMEYTITAVSTANSNCSSSAALQVTRDCECTNHVTDWSMIPLVGPPCPPNWTGPLFTNKCLETLQLVCDSGIVRLHLNGAPVAHCPYEPSRYYATYNRCVCASKFMRARLEVVATTTNQTDPQYGRGKEQLWDCALIYFPRCFNRVPAGVLSVDGVPFVDIPRTCDTIDDALD
jgi:hypothetical protein